MFGAVFEEEAVADRLIADAIADEQVIGAMDGDPAIARIPNARADDAAAAHGVAHQMKMNGVFAEQTFFAQVAKFCIGNATA